MKLKPTITTTLPRSGQFIAVWVHNGRIWSDTLAWKTWNTKKDRKGVAGLYIYTRWSDEWTYVGEDNWISGTERLHPQYMTLLKG